VTLLALEIYKHRVVKYIFFLIVVLTWVDVSISKEIKYTGTFSSLQYFKESGDLGGAELRIVLTPSGYQGVLQIAEGFPGELILIPRLIFNKDKVSFKISEPSDYRGVFEGTISQEGIIGVFTYETGGVLRLNLKRKQSYWD
jgi:hypothetical protein